MTEHTDYPAHSDLQFFTRLYYRARVKEGEVLDSLLTAKFCMVENYLLHYFNSSDTPFSVKDMSPVADFIIQQKGVVTIKQLEDKFHLSRRWLEKQFAAQIGLSPKDFVRITRFNAVLTHVMTTPSVCWSEMTDQFGYYDQSHLIRDFQDFTGQSPTHFFKDVSSFLNDSFAELVRDKIGAGSGQS